MSSGTVFTGLNSLGLGQHNRETSDCFMLRPFALGLQRSGFGIQVDLQFGILEPCEGSIPLFPGQLVLSVFEKVDPCR